ncbi:MAG: S1C family serine protease [Clostridiales bacterium]|jgi:S1-C subfamily serine protease|nr:S1C family serine protease [Clostridiales bacterium]
MTKKCSLLFRITTLEAISALIASFSLLYVFVLRAPSAAEIFDDASQAVVELRAQTDEGAVSYGSAVLIDDKGYLASNAHVVTYTRLAARHEFETYDIRFAFETDYRRAELISYDAEKDIALLKLTELPEFKLKPVKFGSTAELKAGDRVYAVGNAMNHGVSISQGIVSLPKINIEYDGKMRTTIQCDLTINEGNSGGALLNERGKLIGMTTFRIKDSSGNPVYGVAFCIPAENIKDFCKL